MIKLAVLVAVLAVTLVMADWKQPIVQEKAEEAAVIVLNINPPPLFQVYVYDIALNDARLGYAAEECPGWQKLSEKQAFTLIRRKLRQGKHVWHEYDPIDARRVFCVLDESARHIIASKKSEQTSN